MHRFWKSIISVIIKEINPKHIVEIGSGNGFNTLNIVKYCENNNSKITVIDPLPKFDVVKFKRIYKDSFDFYEDISLNILDSLDSYDVILIDGDHNWYTVYNELKTIERNFNETNFPLIFLHDTSWPYGRRDMYYNPKTIPSEYMHEYAKSGIMPNSKELSRNGGINRNLHNAIIEGTEKNGVLTAIEDFIQDSFMDLYFYNIPAFHGLGIICLNNDDIKKIIEKAIDFPKICHDLEISYINQILSVDGEKDRRIKELSDEKLALVEVNDEKDRLIGELSDEVESLIERINSLSESISILHDEKLALVEVNDEKDRLIGELSDEKSSLDNLVKQKEQENTKLLNSKKEMELLKRRNSIHIKNLQMKISEQENIINDFKKSTSWKVTEHFKKIGKNFK